MVYFLKDLAPMFSAVHLSVRSISQTLLP